VNFIDPSALSVPQCTAIRFLSSGSASYLACDLGDNELMGSPKRHHFVPIVHLKHFAGLLPDGHVWTYDASTGNVRSSIPENAAVQTHFYSAPSSDGTMDTRLEDHLARVESDAAPVYEALLRGEIPKNNQARADFATFLALMHVRTPTARRNSAAIYGRILQTTMHVSAQQNGTFERLVKDFEKERGELLPTEAKNQLREDMLDPSHYTMEIPQHRTLMALGASDNLAPLFFEMRWSLVTAEHGYFITSDNPVVRIVDPKTRHPFARAVHHQPRDWSQRRVWPLSSGARR
jgi:hypothetical protein